MSKNEFYWSFAQIIKKTKLQSEEDSYFTRQLYNIYAIVKLFTQTKTCYLGYIKSMCFK